MHYFGEIENGEMQLSAIGDRAFDNFSNVSLHYPYAEIPLFVIMPNHIHAIIMIDAGEVETRRATSLQNNRMAEISNMRGKVSVVIGGLKSAITKWARQANIPFAWQSRFYDRIIRNQDEMNSIATYIYDNVSRWDLDELNKAE